MAAAALTSPAAEEPEPASFSVLPRHVQQETFAMSGAPLGTCHAAHDVLHCPRRTAVWLAARFGDRAVTLAIRHRLHGALALLLHPRLAPLGRLSDSPAAQPVASVGPLRHLLCYGLHRAEGLLEAVQTGNAEACVILLAHGGLPGGDDLQEAAARRGDRDVWQQLEDVQHVVRKEHRGGQVEPQRRDYDEDFTLLSKIAKARDALAAEILVLTAAKRGHTEVTALLVAAEKGAQSPASALVEAAKSGQDHLCRFLLESGLALRDEALTAAAEAGRVSTCRLLLGYCDARMQGGALIAAARHGHLGVCQLPLAHGVKPFYCVLYSAIQGGHLAVVSWLLDSCAWLSNDFLVYKACDAGNAEILQLLLTRGFRPAGSALEIAAARGREDLCELLIEAGAKGRQQALHTAARCGRLQVCQLLLSAGAEADGVALQRALRAKHHQVAKFLRAWGAEAEASDAEGQQLAEGLQGMKM